MNHESAIRIQAAERYVLEDFSPEERAEFETHFFECQLCADEVRAAAILAANAKQVFAEEREHALEDWKLSWLPRRLWWPVTASAALIVAFLAGFGLERWLSGGPLVAVKPQFYYSFAVPAASRAELQSHPVPRGSRFIGARFDLMPGQHFNWLEYEIVGPSGVSRSKGWLKAPPDEGSERELAVPVSSLAAGEYVLILRGEEPAKITEISRARFSIQR